jgi:hypothetical protein
MIFIRCLLEDEVEEYGIRLGAVLSLAATVNSGSQATHQS